MNTFLNLKPENLDFFSDIGQLPSINIENICSLDNNINYELLEENSPVLEGKDIKLDKEFFWYIISF